MFVVMLQKKTEGKFSPIRETRQAGGKDTEVPSMPSWRKYRRTEGELERMLSLDLDVLEMVLGLSSW